VRICGLVSPSLGCVLQVQQGKRSRIGGKLQVNSRGVASLALQLRSDRPQWWGLAGLVPLVNLGLDALRYALSARRRGEEGQEGGEAEGPSWDEQQQQQYMPELAQLLQQHQAALLHQQQ
jgi:hypothetical protein